MSNERFLNIGEQAPVVGLWPGVVAFANDASLCCVDDARKRYGAKKVNDVIWGRTGWEKHEDHEGNPLNVVLYGSEDAQGEVCNDCGANLYDPDSDDETIEDEGEDVDDDE
jgi:hypothetical protein